MWKHPARHQRWSLPRVCRDPGSSLPRPLSGKRGTKQSSCSQISQKLQNQSEIALKQVADAFVLPLDMRASHEWEWCEATNLWFMLMQLVGATSPYEVILHQGRGTESSRKKQES